MIQIFWILISIGFGILTVMTYLQYRRLSNALRAIKLGERVGYPRGVTPFQDSFGELVRLILKDLLLAEIFGFGLASLGALLSIFAS